MRAKLHAASLLGLLSAAMVFADPPAITVPSEVKGDPGAFVQVPATTTGKTVSWKAVDTGLNVFPSALLKDTKTAVVTAAAPGRYRLWAFTAAGDEPSDIVEAVVIVGTPAPQPQPGPQPGPGPTPGPSVRTNPFTDDAPRILVLWDPLGTPLTAAQTTAVYGGDARAAMKSFAGDDGYRIWPKGQQSSTKVWADALAHTPKSYPWLMVGKGAKGFEGPLTSAKDVTDAIAAVNASGEMRAPPVMAGCKCGCVETGQCRCKNCNEHTADPNWNGQSATAPASPSTVQVGGQTFQYGWPMPSSSPSSCRTIRLANGQLVTVCP